MDLPLTGLISSSILSNNEGEVEGNIFGITLASLLGGSKEVMMERTIT